MQYTTETSYITENRISYMCQIKELQHPDPKCTFYYQNLQEEKERRSECLPAEPESDHPDSLKIIFKMPNDTRVERRFLFTQSLSVIHDFLFSLKEAPEHFQIVANFPRRVLPCLPTEEGPVPPTLQEAGLSRSQLLFVQDLTDE